MHGIDLWCVVARRKGAATGADQVEGPYCRPSGPLLHGMLKCYTPEEVTFSRNGFSIIAEMDRLRGEKSDLTNCSRSFEESSETHMCESDLRIRHSFNKNINNEFTFSKHRRRHISTGVSVCQVVLYCTLNPINIQDR